MRNTFINGLSALAEQDPNLYLMVGDLGYGVVTDFAKRFPNQYINAGISEQNMTSVAAGLALEGNTVYTYSIANFPSLRCLEQIRNDICYHNANVKIISVGGALAYGQLGMSHHATEDIAVMRALPNMRVFVPADGADALAVLHEVSRIDGPCYIRLEKNSPRPLHPDVPVENVRRALALSHGTDVSIFSVGSILEEAMLAASLLRDAELSVGAYSFLSVKPLDTETVRACALSSRLLVTLEEHNVIGGLGGAVAETLSELSGPHAPLLRLGLQDTYSGIVGSQSYLRNYYHLDGKSVAAQIQERLERLK